MAIMPPVGSTFCVVVVVVVVTTLGPDGALATGGLSVAHPVATRRAAIERASAVDAYETDFMMTSGGK
jgi:hypothetical protein